MKKMKNKFIWLTVFCMWLAFWLAWGLIGTEYNVVGIICYFSAALYMYAFCWANRNYILDLMTGKKRFK